MFCGCAIIFAAGYTSEDRKQSKCTLLHTAVNAKCKTTPTTNLFLSHVAWVMLSKVAWSIRAWSRLSSFLRIMVVNTCFVVRRQNEGFFVLAKRGRNPTYYTQHQQPTKRRECARTEACKAIHPEENENCLDECVSPFCFDQVYAGAERLEPGEVDPLKRSKFNHCILERVNQKWNCSGRAEMTSRGFCSPRVGLSNYQSPVGR